MRQICFTNTIYLHQQNIESMLNVLQKEMLVAMQSMPFIQAMMWYYYYQLSIHTSISLYNNQEYQNVIDG